MQSPDPFFLKYPLLSIGCSGGGQSVKPKPEGLTYSLEAKGSKEVAFKLVVHNEGPEAQKLTFKSGQEFDFEVVQDGRQIWLWSNARMFTQIIKERILEPGSILEPYVVVWPGIDNEGSAVEPADYEVRGYFLGTGKKEFVAASNFIFKKNN